MGTVILLSKNGEEKRMQYATAKKDSADSHGVGGWLITLPCCGIHFPPDVLQARPHGFSVVSLRRDGAQMQVAAPSEQVVQFKGGAVRIWIDSDGADVPVLDFAAESVSILPDEEGLLFTALGSERFPVGAALVQPIKEEQPSRDLHNPRHDHTRSDSARRVDRVPWLAHNPTGAVVVLNQKASSGMPVVVGVASEGARLFVDREWVMKGLPTEYNGDVMLSTSDGDSTSRGAGALSFDVNVPCNVIVLRSGGKKGVLPYWLASGFEATGEHVSVQTVSGFEPFDLDVYRSKTPMSGHVRLGGNVDFPVSDVPAPVTNYVVLLKPAILKGRTSDSSKEEVNNNHGGKVQRHGKEHGKHQHQASEAKGKGSGLLQKIAAVRQACGTSDEANQCLVSTENCLASFHIGSPDSCACFESNANTGGADTWVGKKWCSARCHKALLKEYEDLVREERNHILKCSVHVE
eukprot:CAMPEP_0184293240 /NCGR_PEP_ID=MMETSP1049-20130417/4747_1 /TAXON_ID=77928 /ORGANISM="Proteomonas sulcata, Strain CCMP704" /LENGTH=462 /DNA_ID=CAMNT_0026601189 /DNA_START=84 /DNA_END=1469 /DNA_ORIENTATION=-